MSITSALREGSAGPGTDTRQWLSYGQVLQDTDGQRSVRFNDDSGSPLPHGVLVDVKLEPSGIVVPCRVGSMYAGNGEGEYYPFGPGDEVLVAIPEGDERAGCVIISRLNQVHDVFPAKVAGQDVTQNNFGFRRHIAPYVQEFGQGYTIRQASTGSAFTLDSTGNVLLNDGEGSLLAMNADVVSLMLKGNAAGLQIDLSQNVGAVLVKSNTASLVLDDSNGSKWQSKGTLSISASGNPGVNHVTTIEAVSQVLNGFCTALAATFGTLVGPVLGAELAALFAPGPSVALVEAALAAAPALPFSPYIGVISAGLSVTKVPGEIAGLGSPGFLTD